MKVRTLMELLQHENPEAEILVSSPEPFALLPVQETQRGYSTSWRSPVGDPYVHLVGVMRTQGDKP